MAVAENVGVCGGVAGALEVLVGVTDPFLADESIHLVSKEFWVVLFCGGRRHEGDRVAVQVCDGSAVGFVGCVVDNVGLLECEE